MGMLRYERVQVSYFGRLGVEVGVFVGVDHLRRAGQLTYEQEQLYFDIDDWFKAELPEPPFYADGNAIGAVTWFKPELPMAMFDRIESLRAILDAHGIAHERVVSLDPGSVVYEDDFQIGVIPHVRREPTSMPGGVVQGTTTARSKRHLGMKNPSRADE